MDSFPDSMEFPSEPIPGAAVLITAAGSSSRFGTGQKKEFHPFLGETVLHHTFMAFLSTDLFTHYCITCLKDHQEETRHALGKRILQTLGDRLILTEGGETRQESVRKGLEALEQVSPSLVLIHDGARPWVSGEVIRRVYFAAAGTGAAAPGIPPVDAMKSVDERGMIRSHLERSSTMAIQTPQGFAFSPILEAHRKAREDGRLYIDDTEIYHRYCGDVLAVPGDAANTKITYVRDLPVSSSAHSLENPREESDSLPPMETEAL